MTDRINALTVVLARDIRGDDAAALIAAIGQFRDVLAVEPHVVTLEAHIAYERAEADLRQKLWDVLTAERAP